MQSPGFAFCIYPALTALYPDLADRRSAVQRHGQLEVNTHPTMAPLLAGITARLEVELEPAKVLVGRQLVMTTLAAWGDTIFWGRIRPAASICGVLMALNCLFWPMGGLVALILYNVPNMFVRIRGFETGWIYGLEVLSFFRSPKLRRLVVLQKKALCCLAGIAAATAILAAAGRIGMDPGLWERLTTVGVLIFSIVLGMG
ncbi:MAG: PTS system mannose/fructose/sorbose family transporter subunit IID, partial [Pseudomonadota bacterium]